MIGLPGTMTWVLTTSLQVGLASAAILCALMVLMGWGKGGE